MKSSRRRRGAWEGVFQQVPRAVGQGTFSPESRQIEKFTHNFCLEHHRDGPRQSRRPVVFSDTDSDPIAVAQHDTAPRPPATGF